MPAIAAAQDPPADLAQFPPAPPDYTPDKTPWADRDFSGTWPYDYPRQARLLFQPFERINEAIGAGGSGCVVKPVLVMGSV